MITIQNYVRAQSLEEAWELNQKKRNRIVGGMLWMKMGRGSVQTAIDLCELGLDTIEESEEQFSIGAMVSLRQLEQHEGLNAYTCGAAAKAVQDIVGVQFRNLATVGGSIWGRFGFSDVLTVFLAMDSYVELYKGGIVPLETFLGMKKDRDILVRLIVKKTPARFAYQAMRIQRTDFPVLTCAVSDVGGEVRAVIGARPSGCGCCHLCRLCRAGCAHRGQYPRQRRLPHPSCPGADPAGSHRNEGDVTMEIKLTLNGRAVTDNIDADLLLIDFLRKHGCLSVKRGCETANCGLCTVLMDGKPILSCSMLTARASGHSIQTLEGLQEEAKEFVGFIADQGADQCGFCNPGFVMNTIALLRENPDPTDDEIRAFLSGNLCRCSGYDGQLRGIRNFLDSRR